MSDALRADEFDLMLSTLRYVLGAGQAKNGEKARDHYNAIINSIASRAERTEDADVRLACAAVKRAALAQPPAPTAQQCTCPSGDGSLRWPCPQHPANIAQPVQQPGAEPDEFLGLPFNEAKTRILALDAESARGMAISFMIQLGLLQKYAAPAQRQPLSDEQIDSLTFQFLTAELGPTAYDRAIARAIEAAHNITAAPAAQKGEKL